MCHVPKCMLHAVGVWRATRLMKNKKSFARKPLSPLIPKFLLRAAHSGGGRVYTSERWRRDRRVTFGFEGDNSEFAAGLAAEAARQLEDVLVSSSLPYSAGRVRGA